MSDNSICDVSKSSTDEAMSNEADDSTQITTIAFPEETNKAVLINREHGEKLFSDFTSTFSTDTAQLACKLFKLESKEEIAKLAELDADLKRNIEESRVKVE